MKEITISVPDGKRAEWVNGVLTLVNDTTLQTDVKPVTERIKTFNDACNALGDEHPLVTQYRLIYGAYKNDPVTEDLIAYLKLRIIVAALNDGWGPKFEEYEHRYYPGFDLYSQEDYDALGDEQKECYVLRSGENKLSYVAFGPRINASVGSACRCTNTSSLLTFRTYELAEYAVMQFTEEWADFMFKPRKATAAKHGLKVVEADE